MQSDQAARGSGVIAERDKMAEGAAVTGDRDPRPSRSTGEKLLLEDSQPLKSSRAAARAWSATGNDHRSTRRGASAIDGMSLWKEAIRDLGCHSHDRFRIIRSLVYVCEMAGSIMHYLRFIPPVHDSSAGTRYGICHRFSSVQR
jgi:hypothetical protein